MEPDTTTWHRCCFASLIAKFGIRYSIEGTEHVCATCGSYHRVVHGQWAAGYRCPRCRRVSFHPKDREEKYCGACHAFEEP